MGKSNFGGMENVGNTTIVTDAALINEHTMDTGLLYAHAVIVHEFEHNQCGSETTMETPFDVWLNEAYTVDVERRFIEDQFNPAYIRLTQVDSIRNPLLGPLAIEDGGHAGRIVRQGFNDPDELIDGVTYIKAAEVIRMLRLILGEERFRAGKRLYFERYRFKNADSDQFFNCFEEASGKSLQQFKSQWLHTIGYPKVTAASNHDGTRQEFRIQFRQELPDGAIPFHLPIALALVDHHGRDIEGTEQIFELKEQSAELVMRGISKPPAFPSINRVYSFYGTFRQENISDATLEMQAKLDPDAFNRINAMKQFTDRQRISILLDPNAEISPEWLRLYGELLSDHTIPSSLAAYFLRIDEQPLDREYAVWYPELVFAREKLTSAINHLYRAELIRRFREVDTYTISGINDLTSGIEDRLLKQVLLDLIANEDTRESHEIILSHLRSATTANDRVTALAALNRSSAPERLEVLEEFYQRWHRHLSGYANYLRVISSGTCPDVFELIEKERNRPTFDVTQPTWSRALFLPMAANNKMVWKDEGIEWITETIIRLAPVNATTTGRLLNTFQHVRKLKPNLREKVKTALKKIVSAVPEESSPSIHRQALAYIGDHP
jgi:aminopeptidase N